jgi:glutathione S-transferase
VIRFYFNFAPNPMKVALLLEEAFMPYEAIPIDTLKGEQLTPAYLAINPNGKLPSIIDDGQVIFDSNAILLYLAEKADQFLPPKGDRGQLLSWLLFVTMRQNLTSTHEIDTTMRPSDTGRSLTANCKLIRTWWATRTQLSTWRSGAGHG